MRLNTCFPHLEGKGGKADSAVAQHPFQPHRLAVPAPCQGSQRCRGEWRSQDHGATQRPPELRDSTQAQPLLPSIDNLLKMKPKEGTRGWLIHRPSVGLLPSLPRDERNRGLPMETQPLACPVHSFYCFLFLSFF